MILEPIHPKGTSYLPQTKAADAKKRGTRDQIAHTVKQKYECNMHTSTQEQS